MDTVDDFVPSKGSSTLSSIFGRKDGKDANEKDSLIYNPVVKQSSQKNVSSSEPQKKTMDMVIMKSVTAYRQDPEMSNYRSLGVMGLSIVGCKKPAKYHLLLYITRENISTQILITPTFNFSISENNYASFRDDSNVPFSVMFNSTVDLREFATKIAETKNQVSAANTLISQDVEFSCLEAAGDNDNQVLMKSTAYSWVDGDREMIEDSMERVVHFNHAVRENWPWLQLCADIKLKAVRVVIVPQNLSEPWKKWIRDSRKLLVFVQFLSLPTSSATSMPINADDLVTPGSPGQEELNLRSEHKESASDLPLESKSQKATLLSRMARLGQATLPLKGALTAQFSDSDSDESVRSPPHKPRARTRTPPVPVERESLVVRPGRAELQHVLHAPHHSTPLHSQILLSRDASFAHTDFLSSHFAEARLQNAELRHGLSKIADKLDAVYSQIHSQTTYTNNIPLTTDPEGLLKSLEAVLLENSTLKTKIKEQSERIEHQNDRIFTLLELSHKTLGQNAPSSHSQDLATQLERAQNTIDKLTHEINEREEKSKLLKPSDIDEIDSLKQKLENLTDEHRRLLDNHIVNTTNLSLAKNECEALRGDVNAHMSEVTRLKAENENLQKESNRLNLELHNETSTFVEGTKLLMNDVYRHLHSEFDSDLQYRGIDIRERLAVIIREKTLELIEQGKSVGSTGVNSPTCDNFDTPPRSSADALTVDTVPTIPPRSLSSEPPPIPDFDEE